MKKIIYKRLYLISILIATMLNLPFWGMAKSVSLQEAELVALRFANKDSMASDNGYYADLTALAPYLPFTVILFDAGNHPRFEDLYFTHLDIGAYQHYSGGNYYYQNAFNQNPMMFYVVCTDVETGQPIYKELKTTSEETYDWIRASASMPLVSKIVELEGYKLLDGGVADSIPLAYFESLGYNRNVVILTQPLGYQKAHNRLMPLMRMSLRGYPKMIEAMDKRHVMYNRQLEFVAQAEREGRCLVIRPENKIPIGHISHDPNQMRLVYEQGRAVGEQYISKIRDYYK